jgi:hypothetical protein
MLGSMGDKRSAYRVLMGKREGEMPLGKPKHVWENNNTINSQEMLWGGMDWIALAQERDR